MENRKDYAVTRWIIDDIKAVRPLWTDEECENFLDVYENEIEESMIRAGWDMIHNLLDEEDPDTYCNVCHYIMNPVLEDGEEYLECSNPDCPSHGEKP